MAAVAAPSFDVVPARPLSESRQLRRRAAEAWSALTPDVQESWRTWAAQFRRYVPTKERVVCPSPRSLYIKAAQDRWRLDPDLPTPLHAPSLAFVGDEIGVFAVPPTRREPGQAGCVRFEATAPNRPGVLTALLLQKLPRSGKMNFRSLRTADFVAFTDGETVVDLPVEPGHYAAAYRFVHAETLQMGPIHEAGRVSIGVKRRKPRASKPPVAETHSHVVVNLARFAKLDVM